jgi:hypothetical protein
MRILILGASYGSLLSTKLLMAGHDVTLVCMPHEAQLINAEGTVVRLTLRGEDAPRLIRSRGLPGTLDACVPAMADPAGYDLAVFAMQEPQYGAPEIRELLGRIGGARLPAMSIMNMPPLPYLKRIPAIDAKAVEACFADPSAWAGLDPKLVTLCSPDPQAVRPPEEKLNFLHVGLPTNFKAAAFDDPAHTAILAQLERDIAGVRLDGKDVPVKLKVHASPFVPFAKWSMLLTGNYRCILPDGIRPIKEAVHSDIELSRRIYGLVDSIVRGLGADAEDLVPFEKYAAAANGLLKPSSAARAIDAGAKNIERVDRLVAILGRAQGLDVSEIERTVEIVDARLKANRAG